MTVDETREAVEVEAKVLLFTLPPRTPANAPPQSYNWDALMEAADAYGDARELKGHVDACGAATDTGFTGIGAKWCGDGYLCDKAKELAHELR